MAIAAIIALTVWKKQIAGASHHELAKKLSGALRKADIARREIIPSLRSLQEPEETTNGVLRRALAPDVVRRSAPSLGDAVEELDGLEGQIAVQWGDPVLSIIDTIRSESKGLFNYAACELTPTLKGKVRGYLASASPPRIAPSFTGRAFERALELYTDLAQEWLAAYVGRDGARAIDAVELAARRRQVDYEVGRLSDPERSAQERRAAEIDVWVQEQGGIAEVVKMVRAELDDESA